MVAGHLREKQGIYVMVLSYTDAAGKRHTPSKTTKLPVRGNKKRAEALLQEWRKEIEEELERRKNDVALSPPVAPSDTPFTQFLLDWLGMMKNSVDVTTFAAYSQTIRNHINPFFEERYPGLTLRKLTPKHIQDYYTWEMNVHGVSANTVIHRHANIRKALQYAFKTGLIDANPADRIERPRKEKFTGSIYNEEELDRLFVVMKGDPLELPVMLAAFYGLRRSCASLLYSNGVSLKEIQEWLGHSDISTTSNIYTHLDYSSKEASAKAILSLLENREEKGKASEKKQGSEALKRKKD